MKIQLLFFFLNDSQLLFKSTESAVILQDVSVTALFLTVLYFTNGRRGSPCPCPSPPVQSAVSGAKNSTTAGDRTQPSHTQSALHLIRCALFILRTHVRAQHVKAY